MKNITLALDDETYRRARIIAAQRDSSVSALVKSYLLSLAGTAEAPRDLVREQEQLLDRIWQTHPGFTAADNLTREALYDQRR